MDMNQIPFAIIDGKPANISQALNYMAQRTSAYDDLDDVTVMLEKMSTMFRLNIEEEV